MCGIVAVVARPGRFRREQIEAATDALAHRGPDGSGVVQAFATERWEVWLGHRRLSIVDLSSASAQPLRVASSGQRGWIAYNGEIYNHGELAPALAPQVELRTKGDTEVLLAGLLLEGTRFVAKTNGMFALVAVDEQRREVIVGRDRLGKKPLYVYRGDDFYAFASELKAFAAAGLPLDVDPLARAYYRWLGYVPATHAIYRRCSKFPAASVARLDLAATELPDLLPELFWDPVRACGSRFRGSFEDAIAELEATIDDATRIRLLADVPVGVFLSGGIDSSLVASSVARRSDVAAYIVRADDPALDESPRALRTATALGMRSEILHLRLEDYERQIDRLSWIDDEPLASTSQIAVAALSERAREHVTVVLTGDGGDEVFLGYPWLAYPKRLRDATTLARSLPGVPAAARTLLRSSVGQRSLVIAVRAAGLNPSTIERKTAILDATLAGRTGPEVYELVQSQNLRAWLGAEDARLLGDAPLIERVRAWYPRYDWSALEARSDTEVNGIVDLVTYMRDDVLVKVDRGTMAYGLEARSPLLDHRVVELGLALPLGFKVSATGTHKHILREICARRIERDLASRPKAGFGIAAPRIHARGREQLGSWLAEVEIQWARRWQRAETRTPG